VPLRKKPSKWTTKEALKRLFPKPVRDRLAKEIRHADQRTMTKGDSQPKK
jgi:hypothetical protein